METAAQSVPSSSIKTGIMVMMMMNLILLLFAAIATTEIGAHSAFYLSIHISINNNLTLYENLKFNLNHLLLQH